MEQHFMQENISHHKLQVGIIYMVLIGCVGSTKWPLSLWHH